VDGEFCASCRWWVPPPMGAPNAIGQCRRHPPQVFMVLAQAPGTGRIAQASPGPQAVIPQFPSAWPPTPPDGFCGEWFKAEDGK